MTIAEIFAAVLVILAGLIMVLTMVGLWRAPDAQTQANMLGPTTVVAIPLLIFAKVAYDISRHGFVVSDVVRALIAVVAYLVVLALGAFLLGRSLLAVAREADQAEATETEATEATAPPTQPAASTDKPA